MKSSDYATHIIVLGWLHIGLGLALLFFGVFALLFLGGIGVAAQDAEAVRILGCIGLTAVLFFSAFSLPGLVAGYGLLQRRPWARVVAIIVASFNLFNIPVGTAIGVYALWLLTHPQAADYFA